MKQESPTFRLGEFQESPQQTLSLSLSFFLASLATVMVVSKCAGGTHPPTHHTTDKHTQEGETGTTTTHARGGSCTGTLALMYRYRS